MENKFEIIKVRALPEDYKLIADAAKKAGIPLAVYVRAAAIKAAKEQK